MTDQTLRRALWASVFYNFGGFLLFAFPTRSGPLVGMPAPGPRVYTTLLAMFVALFGGSYAWVASQPRIDAPDGGARRDREGERVRRRLRVLARRRRPRLVVLAIAGDLVFAVLFASWLLAAPSVALHGRETA
jgi:hypothetical protein